IACTNVAGLLLARAAARRREIGIRLALGARRGQIVRQLLVESLILWVAGGAARAVVGTLSLGIAASSDPPPDRPLFLDTHLDPRVLTLSIAATLVTAIVFGLAPALTATRCDVTETLRDRGRTPGFRSGLRGVLIAGQIALCLVLVVGAALCLRSL